MTDLAIDVRSLTGTFHGVGHKGASEWPPSPFRLFQALRAGIGRVPAGSASLQTLRWLEAQGAPTIMAPPMSACSTYVLSVPNNDVDSVKGDMNKASELRSLKSLKPKRFPIHSVIRYLWTNVDDTVPGNMAELVHRIHTLGLGMDAVFADCRVDPTIGAIDAAQPLVIWRPSEHVEKGLLSLVAQPGSLDSLEQRHAAWLTRLREAGRHVHFSQPPMARYRRHRYECVPTRLIFSLRHPDPDRRESYVGVLPTRADELVRITANEVLESFPDQGDWLQRLVVGRGAGARELEQRLRIVPLPSRGHERADGLVRRLLVEIPAGSRLRVDAIAWALDGCVLDGAVLSLEDSDEGATLRRLGYLREATCWRSVTPVVLDARLSKRGGGATNSAMRIESERAIARTLITALRQAGFPKPTTVVVQREPFSAAIHPARDYAADSRFAASRLFHAELRFAEAVRGPVIIGDGRFRGLGLFESAGRGLENRWRFTIEPTVAESSRTALLRQFRRAFVARAQQALGSRGHLPTLFHGHDSHGGPARSGRHEHLYFRAFSEGGRISAIEILLPDAVDRNATSASEADRSVAQRAVEAFESLRFEGQVYQLRASGQDMPTYACTFLSARYVSTRRPRRNEDRVAFLQHDVRRQLEGIGIAAPANIVVGTASHGPDGLLRATVQLEFERPIATPILIGRDAHFGGGDFVAIPDHDS